MTQQLPTKGLLLALSVSVSLALVLSGLNLPARPTASLQLSPFNGGIPETPGYIELTQSEQFDDITLLDLALLWCHSGEAREFCRGRA